MYNDRRNRLTEIFRDTQMYIQQNDTLKDAVYASKQNTYYYSAEDYPELKKEPVREGKISLLGTRTFETAVKLSKEFPGSRITALNFASAVRPGGGVETGAEAQEECLCRCSTLFPLLKRDTLYRVYYDVNRKRNDFRYTDALIYTPDVVICKTDEDEPVRVPESEFVKCSVITCAAPKLRNVPAGRCSSEELFRIHVKRAEHILHTAAHHDTDILILGAFGCGAFRNDPAVVAAAYHEALRKYRGYFRQIVFAVFTREYETANYLAFKKEFEEEL
ncbi:MAG: TIGR02452 family protein [Solobacterium sp.]|nr:TIGR02452 family protein [Solobacterium sp.]